MMSVPGSMPSRSSAPLTSLTCPSCRAEAGTIPAGFRVVRRALSTRKVDATCPACRTSFSVPIAPE